MLNVVAGDVARGVGGFGVDRRDGRTFYRHGLHFRAHCQLDRYRVRLVWDQLEIVDHLLLKAICIRFQTEFHGRL